MTFYFLAGFSFEPKAKPFHLGDTASHSLPGVLSFSGSFISLEWTMSKCLLRCSFWPQQYCFVSVRAPHVQVESSWSPHLGLIPRKPEDAQMWRFTLGASARGKGSHEDWKWEITNSKGGWLALWKRLSLCCERGLTSGGVWKDTAGTFAPQFSWVSILPRVLGMALWSKARAPPFWSFRILHRTLILEYLPQILIIICIVLLVPLLKGYKLRLAELGVVLD